MKNIKVLMIAAGIVLLCTVTNFPAVAGLPPPWVQTFRFPGKNIDATLLILDYSSLSPSTVVDSEAACEKACKTVLGCNAYVYCSSSTGCGNSCASYVAGHPKLAKPKTSNYFSQSLPIESFGGFQSGTGCTSGSRWKKGLCSLKAVADPSQTPKFSTEVSSGWRSGVMNITAPWDCNGVPFGLCEKCNSLWRFDGPHPSHYPCLQCAANITKALPGGKPTTLEQATRGWACNWCLHEKPMDVSVDRSKCLSCVPKHAGTGLHQLCIYN